MRAILTTHCKSNIISKVQGGMLSGSLQPEEPKPHRKPGYVTRERGRLLVIEPIIVGHSSS